MIIVWQYNFFKSPHIATSYDIATKPSKFDTLSSATEADNATLHGEVAGVSPIADGEAQLRVVGFRKEHLRI